MAYKKAVSSLLSLGFTKGALVEISNTLGDAFLVQGVKQIRRVQEEIIREDPAICLGSSYEEAYENTEASNITHLSSTAPSMTSRQTAGSKEKNQNTGK